MRETKKNDRKLWVPTEYQPSVPPTLLRSTHPPTHPPTFLQAAQQRRQAEELARPRPRTCPSEEAISKAKSMACDRPAVVFGISYRGERDGDRKIAGDTAYHASSPASAGVESAPPPPPPPPPPASEQQQTERQQQRQRQQQEDLSGAWAEEYEQHGRLDGGVGGGREEGEVGCFGDSLGCRELMSSRFLRDDSRPLWETRHGGGNTLPSPQTERMEADKDPLANADGGRGERGHAVTSPRDGGSNSAESSQVESKRNELVESWLLDVRLETETAGTALRVRVFIVLLPHLWDPSCSSGPNPLRCLDVLFRVVRTQRRVKNHISSCNRPISSTGSICPLARQYSTT